MVRVKSALPHVMILGTGGTIAGSRKAAHGNAYASAVTGIDAMIDAVDGLKDLAWLSAEQVFQRDSVEFDLRDMVVLARRVDEVLARDDIDAVVVTHGTDTMEESAFLCSLVINSDKPVVFLGSMRPADALSADGPDNLYDAVAVAAHPDSRGKGVLVVFDDQIHAARDVTKTNTVRTDAFRSPYGPLGDVIDGHPSFVRSVAKRHTTTSAFDITALATELPRVECIMTHPQMPLELLDALVEAGTRGIIHIGPGNGNISAPVIEKLDELRRRGVVIVRATRVGSGIVTRNGAGDDDAHDFVAADDHNPQKARILLSLALTRTDRTEDVQRYFWQH